MKHRNNINLADSEVKELTSQECLAINGGSWLSYIVGAITATLENIGNAYALTTEGKAVQQALVDFQ